MRRTLFAPPRTIRGTLLLLIALALAPLVAFGVYALVRGYQDRREAEIAASAELARAAASTFDSFVQSALTTQHAVAVSIVVQGKTPAEIQKELGRVTADLPMAHDMSWIDPRGIVVASTASTLVGKSMFAGDEFQEILRGAEWRVSPLMQSLVDGEPVFVIARALRRPSGELAGIIATEVSAARLGPLLRQRSDGGAVAIIDSAGQIVATQPPEDVAWNARRRVTNHPLVQRALAGEESLGIYPWPPHQDRRIGALVPIASLGWVAHASRPLEAAMLPVRRAAVTNAAVLLAVALAALAAALVLAGRIAEPLRALEQHAARLATDGPAAAPVRGPAEVRRVARALESMAASLTKRRGDLEVMNRRLAENEERFRLLAENAQDIVYRYRLLPTPGFEYVSPAATRILGYTPEEHYADARLGVDIVHPLDRGYLRRMLEGRGESELLLLRCRRKDGTTIWTEQRYTLLRDAEGRIVAVEGIVRDVTERAEAQEAAERASRAAAAAATAAAAHGAELEAIVSALPLGFMVVDSGGNVLRVNDLAHEIVGAPADELRGSLEEVRRGYRVLRPDGRPVPGPEQPPDRALRGEVVRGEILRIEREGGAAPVWISANAAPIRAPGGSIRGAVVAFLDVTELRQLQDELETLMQMVSHDLRTPLHVVVGHAEILRRRAVDEETLRRAVAILASAGRMTRLIGDLVDAARLEAGHVPLRLEPVDLATFLGGLKERMAGALAVNRVRVAVPETVPVVLADAGRLDQILVNLVSNALKYSVAETEVRVDLTVTGSEVRLAVADRGPGIAPDDVARLFERYYRAKSAARAEGLGLGLFITRKLVDAHGWRIEVASELGRGSVFTLVVPLAGPAAARTSAA